MKKYLLKDDYQELSCKQIQLSYANELLRNIESACIDFMDEKVYNKYIADQFDSLRKILNLEKEN